MASIDLLPLKIFERGGYEGVSKARSGEEAVDETGPVLHPSNRVQLRRVGRELVHSQPLRAASSRRIAR
jgi:hypothetical protein